ncbi:MAG TPA: CHAP domain-containing protein [Roseomonas sp.]|nr:CHAP domain-containing protein [Roseomonas sp.]
MAILLGGLGFPAQNAEARVPDSRNAKPSTRPAAAAPAARTAAPAQQRGANATQRGASQRHAVAASRMDAASRGGSARRGGGRAAYAAGGGYGGGISCVPYARQATGMAISGNGGQWWYNAAGLYARSNRPEAGSIMAFPGSGGMRAGHVAVVERVVSSREVLIHHANWGGPGIRRGSIMRGVSVVDASPNNDWTQVRVQVGHSNENYGRTYPVYGFIHNRPDTTGGAMFASTGLRGGAAQAAALRLEEVAQAPAGRSGRR